MLQDIQEFLDNAPQGVIYFSLGSNLQSDQLENSTLTELYSAFGTLKQKILWKHTGSKTTEFKNIKFVKWVPQQAVLGMMLTVFNCEKGIKTLFKFSNSVRRFIEYQNKVFLFFKHSKL